MAEYSVDDLVKDLKGAVWVHPDDPNVIAENELLKVVHSIETAARKLAELKPRAKAREADESLNFEEQILEAAKSITAAAGALVKAASATQKELVATGKNEDPQWSQNLITAARLVAAATSSLCEAANAAVQGNASEQKIVSSSNAVAESTAQLLQVCRAKADPNSKTQKGLQSAGAAVQRAAEVLVKSAKGSAIFQEEAVTEEVLATPLVGFNKHELEMQELILRKERELEKARQKLEKIRKARRRDEEGDS